MKRTMTYCLLAILLVALLLSACGGTGITQASTKATTQPTTATAAATTGNSIQPVSYPLKNAPKITWWVSLNINVSAGAKSLNETPFAKALMEQTGVQIEFIHPAQGQETEQFNLLLSSGKMTDIVEHNWLTAYLGGPDAAIKNNLMYPLNKVMDTWAADYSLLLKSDPQLDKMAKTDEGNYYGFPFIMLDEPLLTTSGPIIRKDWLDDLGLAVPETVDEWENVLTQFKEKKGATAPLVGDLAGIDFFWNNAFIGAYGLQKDFYVLNGKIVYGPQQSAYRDWLVKMRSWYQKGLINKNFVTDARKEKEANIVSGKAGATFGYAQSTLGAITNAIKDVDPKAVFVGTKYPVLKKGDRPLMGQKNFAISLGNVVGVVNPKSANIETAVKLLNFAYSKAGYMLYNFGVEGKSFNLVNNFPQMTDAILKPASGTVGQAWGQYARSVYNGPFVQSGDFLKQYMTLPAMQTAIATWRDTDAEKYNIPPITISIAESKTYNQIRSDLDAFMKEWVTKAISGIVDIKEYETVFLPTIKSIGVDEATKTLQSAYDRYNAR